jgi:hypothetical protein
MWQRCSVGVEPLKHFSSLSCNPPPAISVTPPTHYDEAFSLSLSRDVATCGLATEHGRAVADFELAGPVRNEASRRLSFILLPSFLGFCPSSFAFSLSSLLPFHCQFFRSASPSLLGPFVSTFCVIQRHVAAQSVDALSYTPAGRGFHSQ